MTYDGQGRNGFSRADLLWSMFAREMGGDQAEKLALSLGFEIDEPPPTLDVLDSGKTHKHYIAAEEDNDEPRDQEDKTSTDTIPPASTASYYRITDRHVENLKEGSETDDLNQLPNWFTEAKATILVETKTRIPDYHRILPLHSELARWSRLEPFLQKVLGATVEGVQVDAERLVKQVAGGKLIRRIPRKQWNSWSEGIRVLVDINDDNFPYRRDFIHLRERLIQSHGIDGLEVQYILDEPGGYITRYEQRREMIEPWKAPDKGVSLLILSDLGMHTRSRRTLYAWLVFGQMLRAQGIRPLALMPVAARNMDKRLFRFFDCFVWDGTSDLKRVKGAYQLEKDERNHVSSVDILLGYFFASMRVDSGLLRAVRYLLPGEEDRRSPLKHQPFDIGHETAVWRHYATIQEGDEWGWHPASKEHYLESAVKLLKTLKPEKRQQLMELIGRYHATYTDELYFEAMFNLMLLESQDAVLTGLVPAEIRSRTHQYMQDLVKTYAENPDNNLLDGWVKRHLERHQVESVRKKHEYWLPFMAFARLHEEQREDKSEIPYPNVLTKEEIAEISRYISHAKTFRRYQLRQKGEKLVLECQEEAGNIKLDVEDDWGRSAVSGALLLNLSLNDERIFHIHTDSSGNRKLVSLNLDRIKNGFDFPTNGKHEFQIGRERFKVDVSTAQQQKEPWMRFIASGSDGLYAESQTSEGDIYRWYWHPPEWNREQGLLPGFWYAEPPNNLVEQTWMYWGRIGRDQYGLFSYVEIADVPLKFRWIEPTAFQMGSPDSEEGRSGDETQHDAILPQGYWLAETTCTQALWQAVVGGNPSNFKGENNPIENISWQDVTDKFLQRVNKQYPELKLRLPIETEWENACRAGTIQSFNFEGELSLDKVNYSGVFGEIGWGTKALYKTAEVKSYSPNQWGLYEMHGNVLEWCQNLYGDYPAQSVVDQAGSSRVLRGGSWLSNGRHCRSAARARTGSSLRGYDYGFRLARDHGFSPVKSDRVGQQSTSSHVVDGQYGSRGRKKK